MGFDVESLSDARFPNAMCPRCVALVSIYLDLKHSEKTAICPGCKASWEKGGSTFGWKDFFGAYDSLIAIDDALTHSQKLVKWVSMYKAGASRPIDLLFRLMAESSHFVHFATWNFTTELIGALAMLATRIPVRGVIGEPLDKPNDAYKVQALKTLQSIGNFNVTHTGSDIHFDQTHQKLYVFDGIVALYGSPNLTMAGWTKADESKELLEISTDLVKVRELNNKYISKFYRIERFAEHTKFSVINGRTDPDNIWT